MIDYLITDHMQKHTKVLILSRWYDEYSPIPCEICFNPAVDTHHIDSSYRWQRLDEPNNLIALCRKCHDSTHNKWNEEIKETHRQRVKEILRDPESWKRQCRDLWYYF